MHETLEILLQEGRAHAGNGDAVAVTELEHRVAMHVGGDRGRQFLHVVNVGELVELDRFVLRIEVVDRLRAFTWVENESVVAGTADGDGRTGARGAAGGSKMIVPPCPSDAFSKLQKSKLSIVIVARTVWGPSLS